MKKIIKWCMVLLTLIYPMFLSAASLSREANPMDIAARLKLYEGFRGESSAAAKVISSYYLKQLSQEDVFSDIEVSKEQNTLKRVFNLTDIKLMTQATMRLKKESNKTPFQVIVLNGRKLLVQMSGIPGQEDRFKVEVFEDLTPPRSLLETKIILPEKKSAVLGFEDSGGHIYFLSFHRLADVPPPPLPPLPPGKPQEPPAPPGGIKKPRLIHSVEPKYPEAAIKAGVEGKVVLETTTDIAGDVKEVKVLEGHPLLRPAAVEALKQWKFEPYIVDGEKKPVQFTVMVNFRIPQESEDKPIAVSAQQVPKLIKRVDPQYPPEAKKAGVSGKVVIEATTDKEGVVIYAVVIDGHPLLNPAALDALRQWKYEPYFIKGVKKPLKFTVVMDFKLMKDEKTGTDEGVPLAISSDQRPRLFKKADPDYPEDAHKAGIQGKVVIEATTDKEGKVVDARVIDGHPLLNQAALKAIRQWEYEPYIINGEKKSVKFTVVMNFQLKDKEKKSEDKK